MAMKKKLRRIREKKIDNGGLAERHFVIPNGKKAK